MFCNMCEIMKYSASADLKLVADVFILSYHKQLPDYESAKKKCCVYTFSRGRTAFPAHDRQVIKKAGHLPQGLKTGSFSRGLLEGEGHVCISSMSITIETMRPTWFCLCVCFFSLI